MLLLNIEPAGGTTREEAVADACKLAGQLGVLVVLAFNGCRLTVGPNSKREDADAELLRMLKRERWSKGFDPNRQDGCP